MEPRSQASQSWSRRSLASRGEAWLAEEPQPKLEPVKPKPRGLKVKPKPWEAKWSYRAKPKPNPWETKVLPGEAKAEARQEPKPWLVFVNRSCGSRSHARAEVVAGLREPKPWEPKPW